jgi:hypothetical protein
MLMILTPAEGWKERDTETARETERGRKTETERKRCESKREGLVI